MSILKLQITTANVPADTRDGILNISARVSAGTLQIKF